MIFKTTWVLEGRILYNYIEGDVSLDAIRFMSDLNVERINQLHSDNSVHIIIDQRLQAAVRASVLEINDATKTWLSHPQVGWVMVVDRSLTGIARHLATLGSRVYDIQWNLVSSIEDALASLQKVDSSLPSLTMIDLEKLPAHDIDA